MPRVRRPDCPTFSNCNPSFNGTQAISLFNIENESLGLVRNLVGVRIGIDVRAGIQPAASDALAFLVRVNDRTVGLIEDLDRREQQRRQLEAERLQARGPPALSPASEKGKGRKRSVFSRLASLSPGSRSRRSLTPPLTPPESPANQSVAHSMGSVNIGGGLPHLPEERPGRAEVGRTGEGTSRSPRRRRTTKVSGLEASPRGRRGGPLPPPVVHDTPQQAPSRHFLESAPVLLHSYAKLLNALVCGSYNLRAAYFSSCEADLRNVGREGGYLVRSSTFENRGVKDGPTKEETGRVVHKGAVDVSRADDGVFRVAKLSCPLVGPTHHWLTKKDLER